ncbi:hypothetical protein [Paenibacillus sp. LjRoot56]|uniref:hypothetical protein n=1 Tax=Paenibacillus sp. LjRoot56 TaxID=3342333 RepID=UPI003ECCADFC
MTTFALTRLNILMLTGAALAGTVDAVLVLGAVVAAVVAVLSVLELQAITMEDSNPMQIRLLAMLLTDPFNTNNSFMIAIIKLQDGRFNRRMAQRNTN